MKNAEKLCRMNTAEKIAVVSGTDFMHTNGVDRIEVPSLCFSDGPHGLRKQTEGGDNGVTGSLPSTAFPTAAALACSFNEKNAYDMGRAIAAECVHYGVDVLLGPAVNIKRNSRCGRNFEYFSEDPLLAGKMGAAAVKGVQSAGVGACVKHFALNNAEDFRFMGNSVCDMRAAREIYLKPFEIIVKESAPFSMMCAYNKINGVFCSENGWLLNEVLRGEWGFDGLVMTDWGAMHDRAAALKAGLDLEMPGDSKICRKWIADGLKSGALSQGELDAAAGNVLNLIDRCQNKEQISCDFDANDALAARIAADCAVLLKNEDNILPLQTGEELAIFGDLFAKMRYQGAGSSMINPTKLTSPKAALEAHGVKFKWARGYDESRTESDGQLLSEALALAKQYEKCVVFAGLTDYVESEGCDRQNLKLPKNQLELIDALAADGKDVIVVLFGGSPVELPFAASVKAILNMYLPGQNGGTAAYNLLFGEACPSGRLAESWVKSGECVPFGDGFSTGVNEIYKESLFVGYRHYAREKESVLYPFGYGLSYTRFEYRSLEICKKGATYAATIELFNAGNRGGAEVVQLYVSKPREGAMKPIRELAAFKKVYIEEGKSAQVELQVDEDALKYFDIGKNGWVLQGGQYGFEVCSDSFTPVLRRDIFVDGAHPESVDEEIEKAYSSPHMSGVTQEIYKKYSGLDIPAEPAKKPITIESRFTDLKFTVMGRLAYKIFDKIIARMMKKACKKTGAERENAIKSALFLRRVIESNNIRGMSMCSGGRLNYNMARGMAHLINGHFLRAVVCICTPVRAPKLPKRTKTKKSIDI